MAAATYFDQVQKLYIAFYQRPADSAGLVYWSQRIDVAGGNASSVVAAFANSAEATSLYGAVTSDTIGAVIDSLYTALFGRVADAAGKAFYVAAFTAGTATAGSIALDVLNGARNDDAVAIANKTQVSNTFTVAADGRALTDVNFGFGTTFAATYAGDADSVAARLILKGVTNSPSTVLNVAQVTALIQTNIANAGDSILTASSGQAFTLTTGVDNTIGTGGNDTLTTVIDGATTTTLTPLDVINGGAGTDTLNINALTAVTVLPAVTVSNVETVNIRAAAAFTGDVSGYTGLTTANVTQAAGALDLTAAATTAVNISGATAGVTTSGGSSVTLTKAMNATAGAVSINKTGAVTVTATDSNSFAGDISIGTGAGPTDAVTGAVVVNSTGAKVVGGTGAVSLDAILIRGGTTVAVTQVATADMGNVATAGTVADVRTQGAVTVTGGNTTTSVSVVQSDQATAKLAVAAVAGVSATQVITFKAMVANDSVTIDGLTFTASKALTAVEAAAAFAGLTAIENQGQGFSTNGAYTGVTSTNWNTGAIVGTTVTYTQKVANTGTLAAPSATSAGTVPTPTAVVGATGVTAVTAVAGVLGVAGGAVIVNDNGATASITTLTLDGYGMSTAGVTNSMNALTTLSLANSGGTLGVTTTAPTLNLTVNDIQHAVTLTDAALKTLNVTTATKDSAFAFATVTTVEALNVAGTNALDLTGTTLTGLKTVVVSGTAGLKVDASGANVTSVTTTATTGAVTATIDATKATYTGGAGVDTVTLSNTAAITKAITLGLGDDTLTLAIGTTATSTVTIDGGAGTDTLAMAAADVNAATAVFAAKFTGFEKLSIGAIGIGGAAATADMSVLNNINYVISANTTTNTIAPVSEVQTVAVTGTSGAAVSFLGATVNASQAGDTAITTAGRITADAVAIINVWNAANPTRELASISNVNATLTLTYRNTEGNVATIDAATSSSVTFSTSVETTPGVLAVAPGGALTITKMANAGTLELTDAGAGATVTMLDATSLTADVFNVVTKLTTADLNYGTVAVAGVETINLNITDTKPTVTTAGPTFGTASIQTATLTISDAAVKAITVTGNANLTLTNTDNVALTTLDASTFTGKLIATTNGTAAETITGGTGADTLTSLSTSITADVLLGGAGNDTLNTNKGLSTLTGGAGVDTFNISVASLNVNSYSTITDATKGDIIHFNGAASTFASSKVVLGSTAVFQDYANAATVGSGTNALSWFQFGADTYIIKDVDASTSGFVNGSDMIVKLTGTIDLSTASFSATQGNIELA